MYGQLEQIITQSLSEAATIQSSPCIIQPLILEMTPKFCWLDVVDQPYTTLYVRIQYNFQDC